LGDIFHGIFGGSSSKQKSESGNLAYSDIKDAFSPMAGYGAPSTGEMAGLLGLGGGDPQAFDKYKNSTGYQFQLDSGSKAITGNAASRGLLNSGATLKAEQMFGQNLGATTFGNYLGQLSDLAKLSLGAGGLITDAGQYSKGKSSSDSETGGFGKFLGMLLACDRRLKEKIERVSTLPDGLPIYAFDYVSGHGLPEGRHVGPMADEVAEFQPWALGPVIDGFATVIPAMLRTEPQPQQIARFI
jgi:hypothetical protein